MKKAKTSEVRIIGGKWRSRRIVFPDVEGLRPTPDRVRETLFNWLAEKINGARCLDCFAGSGVLAFESLSRGAKSVTMIEQNHLAVDMIEKNKNKLSVDNAHIVCDDVLQYLNKNEHAPFDIVYVDPPYVNNFIEPCLMLLVKNHWLTERSIIYFETDKPISTVLLPDGLEVVKEKKVGRIYFCLARL